MKKSTSSNATSLDVFISKESLGGISPLNAMTVQMGCRASIQHSTVDLPQLPGLKIHLQEWGPKDKLSRCTTVLHERDRRFTGYTVTEKPFTTCVDEAINLLVFLLDRERKQASLRLSKRKKIELTPMSDAA